MSFSSHRNIIQTKKTQFSFLQAVFSSKPPTLKRESAGSKKPARVVKKKKKRYKKNNPLEQF